MDETLDKIKDLHLNIDSQSAVDIANSYIQYKYFDSILGFIVIVFLLWGVYKLTSKIIDNS